MRIKKLFLIIFILQLPLTGFQQKVKSLLDKEKYLNFIAAIDRISTFNYFTIIKVKNLNTGITKEICTKGNFVSGAIHLELHVDYDTKGEQTVLEYAKSKKDRYFEFKNKKALDNISFFDYRVNLVDKIQKEYDFNKVIEIIKKDKEFSIRLNDDKMKAFAHVLFNKGFITGESDCFGGVIEYVDRTKDSR